MKVADLPRPITAAKADWLPGEQWVGFSPQGSGPGATAKCQSTIVKQIDGGYVLERITTNFGAPNRGYENNERVVREREIHAKLADSLIAVHRLRFTAVALEALIGKEEYNEIQDIWAKPNERNRWSVAFPIVETYRIKGAPKAKEVFRSTNWQRLFHTQSATLRLLNDDDRAQIASLELEPGEARLQGVAFDQDFLAAEHSDLEVRIVRQIHEDLRQALEGETEERKAKFKRRAAWIADRFIKLRKRSNTLVCDICAFDPSSHPDLGTIKVRSCFDVHHKNPLAEGKRLTTTGDFALLCPTCHRIEHLLLRAGRGRLSQDPDKSA